MHAEDLLSQTKLPGKNPRTPASEQSGLAYVPVCHGTGTPSETSFGALALSARWKRKLGLKIPVFVHVFQKFSARSAHS